MVGKMPILHKEKLMDQKVFLAYPIPSPTHFQLQFSSTAQLLDVTKCFSGLDVVTKAFGEIDSAKCKLCIPFYLWNIF